MEGAFPLNQLRLEGDEFAAAYEGLRNRIAPLDELTTGSRLMCDLPIGAS